MGKVWIGGVGPQDRRGKERWVLKVGGKDQVKAGIKIEAGLICIKKRAGEVV